MIPGSANPLLLASAQAATAYNIERSVRLNSADSAYLSRTPSVAGNRKTWTWAGWVKRVRNGSFEHLFTASLTTDAEGIRFNSGDKLQIYLNATANGNLVTTPVFRDTCAWMHVQVAVDTTQASASDRIKVYVNGVRITAFDTAVYPTQNYDCPAINTSVIHWTGQIVNSFYASLYLADIHFIDGQALDPISFGEFDANGVWQPIDASGLTYGTNGFHLPFSDNSTAAALGTDTSGNSNAWTVNNISVAAGSGNDSLVDTPTSYGTDTGAGGEVRGNYATLNPLITTSSTLSNGNLDYASTATYQSAFSTIGVKTGKWYFEGTVGTFVSDATIGVGYAPFTTSTYVGGSYTSWGYEGALGRIYNNGSYSAFGSTYGAGDVIGVAFDADTGKLWFAKNGTWQASGNPATGANPARTLTTGIDYLFGVSAGNTGTWACNFGQRPFAYTAPSGFKALCTTNLPEPQTITTSGSYTGNGLADGPFVYLNGVPTVMTVNGTAVTFGTHADKLSNGFKLRTTSTTYNQNAATYNYSVTSTGPTFKTARAQAN